MSCLRPGCHEENGEVVRVATDDMWKFMSGNLTHLNHSTAQKLSLYNWKHKA